MTTRPKEESVNTKLTKQQAELLIEIVATAPIAIADLAINTGRTESATRSAVKRLASRGLVECSFVNGGHTHTPHWIGTDDGDMLAEELTI
jgi:predicted transcriptional regulator